MSSNRANESEVVEPHCECGTRDLGVFNVARGPVRCPKTDAYMIHNDLNHAMSAEFRYSWNDGHFVTATRNMVFHARGEEAVRLESYFDFKRSTNRKQFQLEATVPIASPGFVSAGNASAGVILASDTASLNDSGWVAGLKIVSKAAATWLIPEAKVPLALMDIASNVPALIDSTGNGGLIGSLGRTSGAAMNEAPIIIPADWNVNPWYNHVGGTFETSQESFDWHCAYRPRWNYTWILTDVYGKSGYTQSVLNPKIEVDDPMASPRRYVYRLAGSGAVWNFSGEDALEGGGGNEGG